MYGLPWFKTESNIFSNRKIQLILKLTDGDTYFRVWIQLIALAVECNNEGRLEIGEKNPMTIQNFSKIMGKSYKKIEKILNNWGSRHAGTLLLTGIFYGVNRCLCL